MLVKNDENPGWFPDVPGLKELHVERIKAIGQFTRIADKRRAAMRACTADDNRVAFRSLVLSALAGAMGVGAMLAAVLLIAIGLLLAVLNRIVDLRKLFGSV